MFQKINVEINWEKLQGESVRAPDDLSQDQKLPTLIKLLMCEEAICHLVIELILSFCILDYIASEGV